MRALLLFGLFVCAAARGAEIPLYADTILVEGELVIRLVIPPGPLGERHREMGALWKQRAFEFAVGELMERGTFGPDVRDQILALEKPTVDTGYVVFLKPDGQIVGTIRIDQGTSPGLARINKLIGRAGHTEELAAFHLGLSLGVTLSMTGRDFFEAKNLVVKSGESQSNTGVMGGLLLESFVSKLVSHEAAFGMLETDLGGLSEYYVRSVGNWRYLRAYSERTGAEVEIPAAVREGKATAKERLEWIRSVTGDKKEKVKGAYVVLLGLEQKDFADIGERARKDSRVVKALGSSRVIAVGWLGEERIDGCRLWLPYVRASPEPQSQ